MFGLVLFVVFLLVELLLGLKVKRKTISIHCIGILFSNSIDCDVKIRKIPVPYPDLFFFNLQIPILSFIDCISIQTIFCPLQIQLGIEIRLETYALQLTFLTFLACF
jgi:hypothetical protein